MRCFYALILLVPTLMCAQERPNYSGTWKLDPLRSRSEAVKQPKEMVLKIQHSEPNLRIEILRDTNKGAKTEILELKTDGNAVQVEDATVSAAWDEWKPQHLLLTIERRTSTGPVSMIREIRMGDKGNVLTTILTAKDGPSGEKKAYEFYVKE
jgi:hypothetical protein